MHFLEELRESSQKTSFCVWALLIAIRLHITIQALIVAVRIRFKECTLETIGLLENILPDMFRFVKFFWGQDGPCTSAPQFNFLCFLLSLNCFQA